MLQESLNTVVDEKNKIDDELGANILADRRNKLETAAQVISKNTSCDTLTRNIANALCKQNGILFSKTSSVSLTLDILNLLQKCRFSFR